MTNFEKYNKLCLYELLIKAQKAHTESGAEISGLCIIENLTLHARSCPDDGSFGDGCPECIFNWLNEESEG